MLDLHSDTISGLNRLDSGSLISSPLTVTKERLIRGGVSTQCFALYVNARNLPHSPWEELNILHERFVRELDESGIPQIRDVSDYDGSLKVMLTTEEGASIEGDISRLGILKEWGVMIFGLTWNYENELGYPNSDDEKIMQMGLKEKGFEAVRECNRLKIAIDVSHLSDGGFWDVIRTSEKPFFATHSNARALTPVKRNLTDDMIKALADKGGAMGLCLLPAFIGEDNAVTHVSDMIRHTKHIYNTGGEDVLAIGSDADGFKGDLEHGYPETLLTFFSELKKAGFSPSVIEKMRSQNVLRVLSEVSK